MVLAADSMEQFKMSNDYYVSETGCFEQVTTPSSWKKTCAATVSGAKRAAIKQVRGVTFTARVAVRTADGNFQTVAAMHNSTAVTGRRALWTEN